MQPWSTSLYKHPSEMLANRHVLVLVHSAHNRGFSSITINHVVHLGGQQMSLIKSVGAEQTIG